MVVVVVVVVADTFAHEGKTSGGLCNSAEVVKDLTTVAPSIFALVVTVAKGARRAPIKFLCIVIFVAS